LLKSKESPLFE